MFLEGGLDLLDTEETSTSSVETGILKYEIPSESTLIPKVGLYLGLDISETSSGVCIYEDGVKTVANIVLETPEDVEFREVKVRRELKGYLSELIKGKTFNLILIEDAFQGVNPTTTRLLYALNTAIDELILDGICFCKKFLRVSNKSWKSWLFSIDTEGLYKGLTDKVRIQKCLEMLGVHEEGEGFQDRLDACGLILGYFLSNGKADKMLEQKKKRRVSFDDVDYNYQEDIDLALESVKSQLEEVSILCVDEVRWSKSKMLDYLTDNPTSVIISKDIIKLGMLADRLGLPYLRDGGYFAFWVKPRRVKKYIKG